MMIITRIGRFESILFFFRGACFIYTRTKKKRSKMYGGKNDEFVGKSLSPVHPVTRFGRPTAKLR